MQYYNYDMKHDKNWWLWVSRGRFSGEPLSTRIYLPSMKWNIYLVIWCLINFVSWLIVIGFNIALWIDINSILFKDLRSGHVKLAVLLPFHFIFQLKHYLEFCIYSTVFYWFKTILVVNLDHIYTFIYVCVCVWLGSNLSFKHVWLNNKGTFCLYNFKLINLKKQKHYQRK